MERLTKYKSLGVCGGHHSPLAQPSNGNIEAAWFTPGSVLRLSLNL